MQVTILSTSDVHGYFQADDFQRPNVNKHLGLSRAATVIEQIKDQNIPDNVVITIENGDFIQGSPLTSYITRQPFSKSGLYAKLADDVGYDVRVLGNHEFNYGRDYLERLFENDATLLNANIIDQVSKQLFVGQPYRIITQNGLRIGIIGLTTDYIPHWETEDHIKNLVFLDPVETAKTYIQKLRPTVDVLILAYHGGFAQDLSTGKPIELPTGENQGYQLLHLPGVDALVTGHQHRELAQVVDGVPTTQPGYRANQIGKIDLQLDAMHQIKHGQATLIATGDFAEQQEIVVHSRAVYTATNQWLANPIGHVGENMKITDHFAARLHHHPFLELVNQVQMDAGNTTIANTALFNNEMQGLPDAVTQRDIMTNYIYPNTLVVERLSGADIKEALEVNACYFIVEPNGKLVVNPHYLNPKVQHYNYDVWSGIDYKFDFSQPMGQRLVTVMYQGQPLEDGVFYEVAMNNYRATGAGGFSSFSTQKIVREIQVETADLIGEYIRSHPQIKIGQPTNITSIGYTRL
ncbi:2',3'-cyclic-nucleotide 2'-phosphodiesterase/3'-nucleotidase [Weissella uvarum]|uniref:bifunctional metallophosphatase/5'-nucleotidase n=1 Tax=Weissella uvarum TaxID=1479233 RepID=UPI001960FE2B|nr:bifunctional metallophosphatase/5'-nucleotidase [Weissella uvarum]MBM7618040.1 2',3'-cyclic-nucleotide 2'-phosphodiesterase/3'-nucleotidase [Weissella uvarum]MCM0595103.1 bifunctional metallophosphatase/5'-nucleotidase [Weissella uvarum]